MCVVLAQNASTVTSFQAALNIFPFDFLLAVKLTNSFLVLWVSSFQYVLIKDQHT